MNEILISHRFHWDDDSILDELRQLKRDDRDGRGRRVALTPLGEAKLAQSNVLWNEAQGRFEAFYGVDRAAALRQSLAEIFSDEFAEVFTAQSSGSEARWVELIISSLLCMNTAPYLAVEIVLSLAGRPHAEDYFVKLPRAVKI